MAALRFIFLVLTVVFVSLFAGGGVVRLVSADTWCSTTDNFTTGSHYESNLLRLTDDLPPRTVAGGGFAESTAGSAPDEVFGLAMCYADRDQTQCEDCFRLVSRDLQQTCNTSREAKFCYDACFFRYSAQPFFSVADIEISLYVFVNSYVDDMASMNATRWSLMTGLVPEAASSSLRFANGSREYTDSQGNAQVIYGLAQCTRDLNATECERCLKKMVAELSSSRTNNTYGAVKGFSCYVAYKVGEDLGITVLPVTQAPPPLQPLDPSPSPVRPSSSSPSAALIAGLTVGSAALVMCAGISVRLFLSRGQRRRQKPRHHAEPDVVVPDEECEISLCVL